jgi:hypothetical protein
MSSRRWYRHQFRHHVRHSKLRQHCMAFTITKFLRRHDGISSARNRKRLRDAASTPTRVHLSSLKGPPISKVLVRRKILSNRLDFCCSPRWCCNSRGQKPSDSGEEELRTGRHFILEPGGACADWNWSPTACKKNYSLIRNASIYFGEILLETTARLA